MFFVLIRDLYRGLFIEWCRIIKGGKLEEPQTKIDIQGTNYYEEDRKIIAWEWHQKQMEDIVVLGSSGNSLPGRKAKGGSKLRCPDNIEGN